MDTIEKRYSYCKNQMSELERDVWDYIISQREKVIYQSIEDVAMHLHTSTATVSRAVKRLGFAGFSELKFTLKQQSHTSSEIDFQTLDSQMYKGILLQQIRETFDYLSEIDIRNALNFLERSDRIEIFAVGGSFGLGLDLSKKLVGLGKVAQARMDWDDLRLAAKLMRTNDLAIIVSMSGETQQIIEYAEAIRETGGAILSIIGNKSSALEAISDTAIVTKSYFSSKGSADLSSRIGMASVLDYLLLLYSTQ
ncbi:TPA: MurR/RpiR family transcriptional regulator [Streptococcus suis]